MYDPSQLTLVINLGEHPDPAVSQALEVLLRQLAQAAEEGEGLVVVESRETFDVRDLHQYLTECEGASVQQAHGFASRAMVMLLRLAEQGRLVAFCAKCGARRGVCRCRHQAFSVDEGQTWHYYNHPLGWCVNKQSLLALTDRDMRRISKPAARRIKAFTEHLRG